jgi:hypothetical protein
MGGAGGKDRKRGKGKAVFFMVTRSKALMGAVANEESDVEYTDKEEEALMMTKETPEMDPELFHEAYHYKDYNEYCGSRGAIQKELLSMEKCGV